MKNFIARRNQNKCTMLSHSNNGDSSFVANYLLGFLNQTPMHLTLQNSLQELITFSNFTFGDLWDQIFDMTTIILATYMVRLSLTLKGLKGT